MQVWFGTHPTALERIGLALRVPVGGALSWGGARRGCRSRRWGSLRAPHDGPGRLYEERVDRMAGLRVDEVAAEPLQRGEDRARAARPSACARACCRGRLAGGARPGGAARPPPARRSPRGSAAAWSERPVAFLVGGALGLAPDLVAEATSACPWAR